VAPPSASTSGEEEVDHARWGEEFFAAAISEQRVVEAVNTVAGAPIDFGPIGAGPGKLAKVTAHGAIAEGTAVRLPPEQTRGLVGYRVLLPVELTFEVDLQVEKQRFDARLLVPLTLTAVPLTGVRIWIAIEPPRASEVQVEVTAAGLRASVLQRLVGLEGELKRFVAKYVDRELEKPHVQQARLIDVSRVIESAWASLERHRDEAGGDTGPDAAQGGGGTAPIRRTETDESP
jgi:hypothetical protein